MAVDDPGGHAQHDVDVEAVQEAPADLLDGARLEEDVVGQNDGGATVLVETANSVLEEIELVVGGRRDEVVALVAFPLARQEAERKTVFMTFRPAAASGSVRYCRL